MCETILESICAHARQAAERPCLIERGEVWTYAAYWRMILGFSRRLQSLGVEPGEVVVVAAKQTALFLAAGEAVRLAGAVFAPIEQSIGADRVRALVRMLNARALVADENIADCPIFARLADVRAHAHRDNLPTDIEFPGADSVTDILFTSGSTDKPKAVEVTAGAMAARGLAHMEAVGDPPDAVEMLTVPLNHSFATSVYAGLMRTGATAVLSSGVMDLGQMYRMIDEHRVTGLCLVPAALSLILKYSQDRFAGCAEKLRYLRMGGAKPIEGDARRAHALMPDTRILNVYGATETGTVFGAELGPDGFDPACVGRSVGELTLKFVDAEGREVGVSREAPGYVAIRSARNMRGYFGNPALTKSALSADGFVRTCDLGYLGADGKLHLAGREGGVLCVGGFMVSLDELERIARSMDGVED
ncbi:MAG: acyl--CoA ligase, partial [Clostridiales bacterium]|nr:acyl--CoA ligase [Clostridiales bacterium]